MKLLDVATVNQGGVDWRAGANRVARECGVQLRLTDACEEESIPLIGDETSEAGSYFVKPFSVEAEYRASVMCEQPDDAAWLEKVLRANLEYPLSRALVEQPIAGTDSWLNNAGVQTVTLAGSSADQYATAIIAARKLWYETVLSESGRPIMHVPPSLGPKLVTAGVLQMGSKDEAVTVWGEPVVLAEGYERATPNVFFSGDIKIDYLEFNTQELRHARVNSGAVLVNTLAIVDTPPCAIVRVGTYTA